LIFVTVGNARQGFDRLIAAAETLSISSAIQEEIVVQHGHTKLPPVAHFTPVAFVNGEQFERYLRDATAIVSHGGCGTLLQAIRAGKVPVVVPRREKFAEHVNDHQMELARELERQGHVVVCEEPGDLLRAIEKARMTVLPPRPSTNALVEAVGEGIRSLLERKAGVRR
jgi:UDP-N-acetylglucosamine transferase subunit ALG13